MVGLREERAGSVAILTLDRPEAGNKLTTRLAVELCHRLQSIRDDDAVGACVLTGAGNAFCLGGDYAGAGPAHDDRVDYANALIALDTAMVHLGKPLLAAVNGDAHAGGFATMTACDFAVAAEDATFGLPEASKGLFPFIATAIVKDVIPKAVFFDLAYRARLLSAEEACGMGLVVEVVPRAAVLPRTIELAGQMARYDREVVRLGRNLYYGMQGMSRSRALEQAGRALLDGLAAAASSAKSPLD